MTGGNILEICFFFFGVEGPKSSESAFSCDTLLRFLLIFACFGTISCAVVGNDITAATALNRADLLEDMMKCLKRLEDSPLILLIDTGKARCSLKRQEAKGAVMSSY